jgi:hypothetical protein
MQSLLLLAPCALVHRPLPQGVLPSVPAVLLPPLHHAFWGQMSATGAAPLIWFVASLQ